MKQGNITKLDNNRYRLRYQIDNHHYSKNIKASSLSEAKHIFNEYISNLKNNKITKTCKKMQFIDLTQLWLDEYLKPNATPKTVESTISVLNRRILPVLGDYTLDEITPLVLNHIANEYKKEIVYGHPIAAATIKKRFSYISSILNFAYRSELIDSNPYDKVKLNLKDNKGDNLHFYDANQVKKLFVALEDEPEQIQLIIKLAIFGGLRKSEIFGLKLSDINFKNNTIHIQRTKQKIKNDIIIGKTKTNGSNRQITVNKNILNSIHNMKLSKDDYIFDDIYINNLAKRLHQIQKKANLPEIRFHDLRHTNGTLLLSSGIDVKTVSEFLGHNNIRTTSIYLHAIDNKFKKVSSALDNVLK